MSNPSAAKILIVDDEAQIRKFLRISLGAHGYEVSEASTGKAALELAVTEKPSAIILDLGLPDMDGKKVIEEIRGWSDVPILILSVRSEENEKVQALDVGASDYVTKPFGIAELLARLRTALRIHSSSQHTEATTIETSDIVIDLPARRVSRAGEEVKLTRKEFEVLRLLASNAGRIVTHGYLLDEIWGKAHMEDTHYLRIIVSHLRQKLDDNPASPRYIENEPGVGYRFIG